MTNRDPHIASERPRQRWPELKLRDGPGSPKGGDDGEAPNGRLNTGIAKWSR